MYKDRAKQREAVKMATRRYRKRKGITKVSHNEGITEQTDRVSQEYPASVKDSWEETEVRVHKQRPKPQSHSPMMVGYVPPTGE